MPTPTESARRAALIDELRLTDHDPQVERVARIGALAANAPMAAVTFVSDSVQFNVARVGFDASQTPLSDAFCVCALDQLDLLIIEDARLDPRVAHSELVTGSMQVRSYAGAPIKFEGVVLGTVCVMDREPRAFDARIAGILADLSVMVADMLRLKREAQLRLRDRQRAFDCASAAGQWIWELGPDRRLVWMDGLTECTTARLAGDTLGQTLGDGELLDWSGAPQQPRRTLNDLLDGGQRFDGAITAIGDGQEKRLLERCAVPLSAHDGSPLGWRGVSRDVTDRVRAEIRARSSDAAIRANQSKSEFLSRVSHELRTPLNGLLGYAQLIQMDGDERGGLSIENRRRLDSMMFAGRQLLALIDDMLDLARIEQGKFNLALQALDVFDLASEVCAMLAPMGVDHQVTIRNLLLPGECVVLADRRGLTQVLSNLLSNAIKYNRPSGIVMVRHQAQGSVQQVVVEDNGRGMTPAQLDALFQPFNRVGAPANVSGSGLGLVITRALLEQMGGGIQVQAQPGVGTSVEFSLPAAAADAVGLRHDEAGPAHEPAADVDRRVILYVEDNELNVLLLRELIAREPAWQLVVATVGAQAPDLARLHRPHVVLVDMQLPDMDGLQVLWTLRDANLVPALGCIALSADAMPEKIALARDAGFADYWTKPLDLKATLARLRTLFSQDPGA